MCIRYNIVLYERKKKYPRCRIIFDERVLTAISTRKHLDCQRPNNVLYTSLYYII